jgi:hypothetical protein
MGYVTMVSVVKEYTVLSGKMTDEQSPERIWKEMSQSIQGVVLALSWRD